MSRLLVAVMIAAAAASSACAHRPQTLSPTHVAAMRDSVQETLNRLRHFSATSQWDSLVRLYADDPRFRWIENGEIRYRSVADIRKGLARLPANLRIETTYEDTEIIPVAPGLALVNTRFRTQFIATNSPGFGFGGAITMTLTHGPDGWRILNGHTSSPVPR